MTDDEIDFSDNPEPTAEQFAKAKLVLPGERLSEAQGRIVRLATDLSEEFKTSDDVNAALRLVKQLRELGRAS